MNFLNQNEKKIPLLLKKGKIKTAVFGLGYIGLSLAAYMANLGVNVIAVERDVKKLKMISKLQLPIYEPRLGEMLKNGKAKGCLKLTANAVEATKESSLIMITVGTPVSSDGSPILKDLEAALTKIAEGITPGKFLVLISTVPPHTTQVFVNKFLEDKTHLKAGVDYGLAFCPERTVEGQALKELGQIPHIVGGINPKCTNLAAAVFSIFKGKVVKVNSPAVAEMAKIFDNVYRDVNIALANELALICEALKVDVVETIAASNTSPRTKLLIPGAGVGGSCLNKDPPMLSYIARQKGAPTDLIENARKRNVQMPNHVVDLTLSAYEKIKKPITSSKTCVLGLAFKSQTDDLRETVAKPVIEGLLTHKAKIVAFDPFVSKRKAEEFFPNVVIASSLKEAIKGSDLLILLTDHESFKNTKLTYIKSLMAHPSAIVDGRQMFNPKEVIKNKIAYYGVGRYIEE